VNEKREGKTEINYEQHLEREREVTLYLLSNDKKQQKKTPKVPR